MFNRKNSFALTPTCVLATLAITVAAVFAVLVDAVAGMEAFL
jgi:hypothetical protein